MDDDLLDAPPLRAPLHTSSAPRDHEPPADEFEKIRRWQEERLARRLKGEYESAVQHLSELVTGNLHTPSRVTAVRVDGAPHTRASFLQWLIKPHLAAGAADDATLESVLHSARHISHFLKETDIFQTVEAKLEASRDVFAKDGDVEVAFRTKEKGRFYLKTATEVGNSEGSASVTARVRNVFGGAETFEFNFSTGTKTRRSFHALLSAPLTPSLRTQGEISLYGLQRDNSSYASSSEGLHGVKLAVRSGSRTTGLHELTYDAVLRHIGGLTPTASVSMREAAGHNTKSAVSHSWTRDTRDDKIAGTRGVYTKLSHELAGLGGDASFYKAEADGQISRSIGNGMSISLAARSGALLALSRPTLFSDRFQLGGPSNLRMFRANSMGPRDGTDSLGGDLYWSAGASVVSDIPRKAHWPIKAHAFVNAGRLDVMNKSKPFLDNVLDCVSKPSVSAGVGLIYRFDPIRVEVNFGVPLAASRSDGYRRGFQVGMGIDFL